MDGRMNSTSTELLLGELLDLTLSLENIVKDDTSEPEVWIEFLDKRQELIDELSGLIADGYVLTDRVRKEYVEPAYLSDQNIIAIMEHKRDDSKEQLVKVRRSKAASEQYSEYGKIISPYGAFVDKKN